MEYSVKSGNPEKQRTACIVLGVFEPRKLTATAEQFDKITDGFISNILRRGDLEGKLGQVLLLHSVPNTLSDRVLLVGCGKERELGDSQYQQIITKAVNTLNDTGSMEAVCFLTELNVKGRDSQWKVKQAVAVSEEALYSFEQLKSKASQARRPLRKIIFNVPTRRELSEGEEAIKQGEAIALGITMAKNLANLPGNICTPSYLAEQALQLANNNDKVTTSIIDEDQMKTMGMGAFISVSQGSDEPGKLITIEYKGAGDDRKPIVLVGKGITFDSGGISLKPGAGMDEMKFDMGGAAAVLGTTMAVIKMGLAINLVTVIAAAENMPSSKASRPGDVVTSMSGQTIEILNTDAEGRLVLCDALTYVEKFDPDVVIDVATLTGAIIVALGHKTSGIMSNHNPLAHDLLNAGEQAADRAWRLPIWDEYQEQLDSNFADMANLGGPAAGSITAACFLSRFTKKYQWAHIDIAGTAWNKGKAKGGTGRPVALLSQYIINRAAN